MSKRRYALLFDLLVASLVIVGVMGTVWLYSEQPFPGPPPLVVIETSSMVHDDAPFGRIGTIDPGDIVIAKSIHGRGDIITRGGNHSGARFLGYKRYGDYGDVIIYKPLGRDDEVPIIHRAICWVEYDEENGTYTVEEYGIYNATSITIPELNLYNVRFSHSGFITKGDHNLYCDQDPLLKGNICPEPVKLEWIVGKAEGELPWFGSLKLLFEHLVDPYAHPLEVPNDSWICLSISIAFLIGIPLLLDIRDYLRERKGLGSQEGITDKMARNKIFREKILRNIVLVYWIILLPLLALYLRFTFLLIIPITIFLANIHLSSLVAEDGKRWGIDGYKRWALFTLLTGPVALSIYYFKIKTL